MAAVGAPAVGTPVRNAVAVPGGVAAEALDMFADNAFQDVFTDDSFPGDPFPDAFADDALPDRVVPDRVVPDRVVPDGTAAAAAARARAVPDGAAPAGGATVSPVPVSAVPVSTALTSTALTSTAPTGSSTYSAAPGEGFGAVLPVADALAAVLPRGGLARGSVVSVLGRGATSLLFTLLAGPPDSWSALVGMPGLGLLAATEFGIDLNRLAVIPEPGPDVLQVLSILVDGVDMIAVTLPPQARPTPARQRVLTGRLRQRGSVLLVMGPWPGADLVLTAQPMGWSGLGSGHGRLRDRELAVEVGGRGAAAGRTRRAVLLLSAGRSTVSVLAAAPVQQTADRDYRPVADVG